MKQDPVTNPELEKYFRHATHPKGNAHFCEIFSYWTRDASTLSRKRDWRLALLHSHRLAPCIARVKRSWSTLSWTLNSNEPQAVGLFFQYFFEGESFSSSTLNKQPRVTYPMRVYVSRFVDKRSYRYQCSQLRLKPYGSMQYFKLFYWTNITSPLSDARNAMLCGRLRNEVSCGTTRSLKPWETTFQP